MDASNFVDSDIPEDAIPEDVIDQEEVETVSAEDENDVEPVDTIVLKKSSEEVEENDEEIMNDAHFSTLRSGAVATSVVGAAVAGVLAMFIQ